MYPSAVKIVPKENQIFSHKLPMWFDQLYEQAYEFKKYIKDQGITEEQPLSVDQAIVIMTMINTIDTLRICKLRTILFIHKHPEVFEVKAVEECDRIGMAFRAIDRTCIFPYEKRALESLNFYIGKQNKQIREFAFDGELKVDDVPSRDELVDNLSKTDPIPMNKRLRARDRWRFAISSVTEQNRFDKIKKASILFKRVAQGYTRVDEEVRDEIEKYLNTEYQTLMKLQEAFTKWLDVFEEVIKIAEQDIKEIAENLDQIATRKARIIQMLIRGAFAAALGPFFLTGFIDPTLAIANSVIQRMELMEGNIELNINERATLYSLTGFLPDPDKTVYRDAYKKLSEETAYQKIERYKKYIEHKYNSLSESRELLEMMREDSKFWGEFSTKKIIEAHRMATIDRAHYMNKYEYSQGNDDEFALKNTMVKPFKTVISSVFSLMKMEYGDDTNLEALHRFLDLISFDDKLAGPDAHKHSRSTQMIQELANHMEIYYIVHDLVENTKYFGGDRFNTLLHHDKFEMKDEDRIIGLKPDDGATSELIMALLKRIIMTDNVELKKKLQIDPTLKDKDNLKHHPLIGNMVYSRIYYQAMTLTQGVFFNGWKNGFDHPHQLRRNMVKALIDEYYNYDIAKYLQKKIVFFAQKHGITISQPEHSVHPEHLDIDPNWLSEDGLRTIVTEKFKPFIEAAQERKEKNHVYGTGGLLYYRNAKMIQEAARLRAIELTDDNIETNKRRVSFKE